MTLEIVSPMRSQRPSTHVLKPLPGEGTRRRTAPAHVNQEERRLSRGASFLTSHGRQEFESALSKSSGFKSKIQIERSKSMLDKHFQHHHLLRSKTFLSNETKDAQKPQPGTSGPTKDGSLLNSELKSKALQTVQTKGGRVLDDESRRIPPVRRYEPPYALNNTRVERNDQSGFTICFDTPYVEKEQEKAPADAALPPIARKVRVRLPPEPYISEGEEEEKKKKPVKENGNFGAAGKRIAGPNKLRTKKTKSQSQHWADDATVSSEDEGERRERIRDTNKLYLDMFGFSVLKKSRGGKDSRMGKRKSFRDIAVSLKPDSKQVLDTIADDAVEKAQGDEPVAERRIVAGSQEERRSLPALACPSSEIKSRQVGVSRWITGNTFIRPTSRTVLALV